MITYSIVTQVPVAARAAHAFLRLPQSHVRLNERIRAVNVLSSRERSGDASGSTDADAGSGVLEHECEFVDEVRVCCCQVVKRLPITFAVHDATRTVRITAVASGVNVHHVYVCEDSSDGGCLVRHVVQIAVPWYLVALKAWVRRTAQDAHEACDARLLNDHILQEMRR